MSVELYPTSSLLRRLEEHGDQWGEVVADLEQPEVVMPVAGSETRRRLLGARFVGFAEPIMRAGREALLVVGVMPRERATVEPGEAVVGVETQGPTSSRRGGSGRRWPTTWGELVERVNEINGYRAEAGKTHIILYDDGHRIGALPKTASEYRGLVNACLQLRRKGIDVSRFQGGWSLTLIAVAEGFQQLVDYLN